MHDEKRRALICLRISLAPSLSSSFDLINIANKKLISSIILQLFVHLYEKQKLETLFLLHASHTLRAMNNSSSRDSVGCACLKCICNSMMRCLDVQLGMQWRGVSIAFSDGPLIKHAKPGNFNKCSQICRWWVATREKFISVLWPWSCLWRVASTTNRRPKSYFD